MGEQWYLQGGAPVRARRGSEPVMLPVQRAQWEAMRGLRRDGDELGDVQSRIRMGSGCVVPKGGDTMEGRSRQEV